MPGLPCTRAWGGVPVALEDRFTTTEPDLGPQARIPPPLDGVGAKLRLEWLQRSIHDGEGVRPYMLTRMPAYGQKGPTQLPQNLHEHDRAHSALTAQPLVEPANNEERKTLREGGRQLVGSEGLQCITCHRFNGQPSPQFQGMDLIAMPERLQPDWFQAFLLDPTAFRPGIVMPTYWPGGEATTHILEGQTQTQLQALWTYLTLGRSARDPVGIRSQGSRLTVTGRPLTYRGRSQVAGYRGIAVGFPQGIHYALQRPDRSLGCPVARGIHLRRLAGPGIGAVQPHRAANQTAPGCRLPSPERARRALAASPPNHQGSPGEP